MCLGEHWQSKVELSGMHISEYVLQASYYRDACQHGGVAAYGRKNVMCRDVGHEAFSVPVHAEFAGVGLECVVISVYRSSLSGEFLYLYYR